MQHNFQKEVRWLLEEKYDGKRTAEAEQDIKRLREGEHIDYVIGWIRFLNCKIDLSQKPLIPRPETEYWTREAIQQIAEKIKQKTFVHVLDIFAGSGCVGVVVLKEVPKARVDFAEKEKRFLKQSKINAELNDITKSRYQLIQSDIFSNITGKYDFILANPPYVAEQRKSEVQESVLIQEPEDAVFGGSDGLSYIRPFLQQAKTHLREGGSIWLEFDSHQKSAIEKLLEASRYSAWKFYRDQYKKWRYCVIFSQSF